MDSPFKPKKILIADDEEDIRLYLIRYFERRNFQVMCASDGSEAQKFISEGHFDFLFLDCSMPEVTGIELIDAARQRNPAAKIFLISGVPSIDAETVRRLGGDGFLHKPLQLAEIEQLVKE